MPAATGVDCAAPDTCGSVVAVDVLSCQLFYSQAGVLFAPKGSCVLTILPGWDIARQVVVAVFFLPAFALFFPL